MAQANSAMAPHIRQLIIGVIGQRSASRLKRAVCALFNPTAWLRLFFVPLRVAVDFSPSLYWGISEALRRPGRNRRAVAPGPAVNKIDQLIFEMNTDGTAKWERMYTEEVVAEARGHVEEAFSTAQAKLDKLQDGKTSYFDEETGFTCRYTEVNSTRLGLKDVRRGYPHWLRPFTEDPRSIELVSKYWGVQVRLRRVMIEEVTPDLDLREGDEWHIDVYNDQLKVWILLTDVGPDNAATRYKLRSHDTDHINKVLVCHNAFRYGVIWTYPGSFIANTIPGENTLVAGRAGDCFFLDTTGFHSRTPCHKGKRLVMVLTYYIPTFRNRFLHLLKRDWTFD